MSFKILVATRSFGSTSTKPWDVLNHAGCELIKADMSQKISEERLIELLEGVDGAIIGVVPMTSKVIEKSSLLKVVSMHGVGVDHIDLVAAKRRGIVIANCPGTNDQAVADLTIGLMIAIARKIPFVDRDLRQGDWSRNVGSELWNKTLGLIGFGQIGRGVARRALGFDMKVLAFDPYVHTEQSALAGVAWVKFEELVSQSDFISLHATLTEETRHMISAAQLSIMKPTGYLINTARGELVDEQVLYDALDHHQIAGAALDVFTDEPPRNNPLLQLENVVVTPHIGAHTSEAIERMGVMAAENVILTLQGGEPHHRVI